MQKDMGRVVGSKWYSGTDITGSSTTPTIFEDSGITYALEQDMYLNTTTGNLYECTVEGDAETAKWVYSGCIAGPQPEMVDNLNSDLTTKALTARQGKILNNKILSSGVFTNTYDIDVDEAVYIAEIKIRNVDGTITLKTETETVNYTFTQIGVNEQYTVSLDIGVALGFLQEGAVLTQISFTDNIYSIVLKDSDNVTLFSQELLAWNAINNALAQVRPGGTITDGDLSLKGGTIHNVNGGTDNQIYPTTHAKAVWYDKTNNETVHSKIEELESDLPTTTNNTSTTAEISRNTNIPTMNTLSYALNRTTGIGSADTNYSTSMMRGISAGTTDLTAGTSALTSGAIYLVYQ